MYGSTEELWFPEWEQLGTPWTNPEQYTKWSPSYYVKNFKTPCLVVHSQNDFRVPLEQGLQLFTSLQRMNVPSKFLYLPRRGPLRHEAAERRAVVENGPRLAFRLFEMTPGGIYSSGRATSENGSTRLS